MTYVKSKANNIEIKWTGYGSGDGVDASKNWLHFGIHMVIKTPDDSTCKMYNWNLSYIYLAYM